MGERGRVEPSAVTEICTFSTSNILASVNIAGLGEAREAQGHFPLTVHICTSTLALGICILDNLPPLYCYTCLTHPSPASAFLSSISCVLAPSPFQPLFSAIRPLPTHCAISQHMSVSLYQILGFHLSLSMSVFLDFFLLHSFLSVSHSYCLSVSVSLIPSQYLCLSYSIVIPETQFLFFNRTCFQPPSLPISLPLSLFQEQGAELVLKT